MPFPMKDPFEAFWKKKKLLKIICMSLHLAASFFSIFVIVINTKHSFQLAMIPFTTGPLHMSLHLPETCFSFENLILTYLLAAT